MRDHAADIGTNAGKIWSALNTNGTIDENKLKKITNLEKSDLYTAIGWLARENKISEENGHYKLEDTNLTSKIGSNAGKVWKILDIWGEVDVSIMSKLSEINEHDIYQALGWLACEDKICIDSKMKYYLK